MIEGPMNGIWYPIRRLNPKDLIQNGKPKGRPLKRKAKKELIPKAK